MSSGGRNDPFAAERGDDQVEGLAGDVALQYPQGVQNPPAPTENTDQATWSRILDINLTGTLLGIKVAIPALRRAAGGAIVNIASAG